MKKHNKKRRLKSVFSFFVLSHDEHDCVGNVNENVNINLKGKDLTIAFNGKYLTDYLKTETADFIVMNLNSAIDPCVLKAKESEDFIYLVLPVRINA